MATAHAIRIHEHGAPAQMRYEMVDVPDPGRGEIQVRHTAIGVNFIDVYERTGLYKVDLPAVLGREAAGVVEAVGPDVRGIARGDRVAYAGAGSGAYSERRTLPAERVVKVPDTIGDDTAAALMLKGLTAQMLLRQVYRVRRGDVVVVQAAAGGVGLLLVQWARHLGAMVIAIVSNADKAKLVRSKGVEHVLPGEEPWDERIRELTKGQGAHVVYDSVGRDTFARSLKSLRPRGMMVTFGNSSGPVDPVAPLELARHGSLFLTRPVLFNYITPRVALLRATAELFDLTARSVLEVHIGQRYELADAARAHEDLEARRTTGSSILLP